MTTRAEVPDVAAQSDASAQAMAEQSIIPTSAPRLYRAGTLIYTRWGLVRLFAWLLWGDFCFGIMEIMMPQLLPISLRKLGASNAFIGIVMGAIPSIMLMVLSPIFSTMSDRHRGPWGRRIPFLFWPTPFLVFFLVMIGWSPRLGSWLHSSFLHGLLPASATTLIFALVCISMIGFQFLNSMVAPIYYYLWADVVPPSLLGRFVSFFRVVEQLAIFVWSRWIFGKAEQHEEMIYLGVGVLYLISFMVMCWRIKEGQYPPPPPTSEAKQPGRIARAIRSIRDYLYECFSIPIYRWNFLMWAFVTIADGTILYVVLFCRETLKLSLDDIGKTLSWANVFAIPSLLIFGWVADRIHPLRTYLLGTVCMLAASIASFYFIHDSWTLLIFYVILTNSIAHQLRAISSLTLGPLLYPKEQFGQFSSAGSSLCSLFSMMAIWLGGIFIDYVKDYRYIFAWRAVFLACVLVPAVFLYRNWKKHGGARNYVAPIARPPGEMA